MFNKQNFCHVASNNRNERKAGIFVYKTTDDLDTISASGYFNEKIIDLNLHDLIIHEQTDNADRTKVKYNYLAVTERTLDNVGTTVIKRDLDISIEEAIEELREYVDDTFVRLDGTSTMTGPLEIKMSSHHKLRLTALQDASFSEPAGLTIVDTNTDIVDAGITYNKTNIELYTSGINRRIFTITKDAFHGGALGELGTANYKWPRVYVTTINNGYDIAVPVTNSADTLALKSQVDDAANSGTQLTEKGVWYAKMYAATTAPAAEDGTNYADFSQVDGQGNPIIVTYNRVNGAWVQDQTITPPADYNGYVTVTSKIWDIVEQDGQQGGLVLWSYNQKTFTPYPKIISFEDAALTGTPTAPDLTQSSPNDQIVNKQSLDNALLNHGTGRNVGDVFWTMRKNNALNGAVACNGATYDTGDFDGAQSIGDLLQSGEVPYVSLAQYATLLSTNGSVGVFGWDGGSTTTFRVPSLNDIFLESGTAAQIGNYLPAGVPNLEGTFWAKTGYNNQGTGAFSNIQTTGSQGWDGSSQHTQYRFRASDANSTYGNSSTVQPKAVRYRPMVQLAVSASDEAVETCTGVLADVANLKDLSNITQTGKTNVFNCIVPDYSAGTSMGLPTNPVTTSGGTVFTCPKNGWIRIHANKTTTGNTLWVMINGLDVGNFPAFSAVYAEIYLPVLAGDRVAVRTDGTNATWIITTQLFIPVREI